MPSNTLVRIAMTLVAMLAAMCMPGAMIAVWDVGAKRINTSADVSKGLRLPVLGSVPLIPANVIRRLGSPSKRCQTWQVRLTESVDGIAARLLHKAEMEQCRVIMVSSAAGGEGKTTLATQLALSLARAGRRTVLVDFDLRRPAFDEVFGLPLAPGVCEMLRQESEISALVHEVATKNLAVVTAGRWDRSRLGVTLQRFGGRHVQETPRDLRFRGDRRQSRAAGGRRPLCQPARQRGAPLRLPRRQQGPENPGGL